MKKIAAILALVALLIVYAPSSAAGSENDEIVRITDVQPSSCFEGIGITNFGDCEVNLIDYTIEDGEGKIIFKESLILGQHSTVFICKEKPADWFDVFDFVLYGEKGIECKSFALNDDGDEVMLCRDGIIVDMFAFGNSDGDTDDNWKGERFPKIPKTKYAHRCGAFDTDSSSDWTLVLPGKLNFENEDTYYDAAVAPFVFPDSKGMPVIYELSTAKEKIEISIYMLSHDSVVSVLLDRLRDGVKVEMLVEGSPVGGMQDGEITALCTLSHAGADVKAMKSSDGYKRFDYNHSKYAVIDRSKTIITTENWTASSFNENIGWGAIIYSQEFADYYSKIFANDFENIFDTVQFNSLYNEKSKEYGKYTITEQQTNVYNCKVKPVISPDTSWESMKSFIADAKERIFTEQLEIESSWISGTDNPIKWIDEMNVDSRLIVNTTYSDIPEIEGMNIAVRNSENLNYVHNKGMIVDNGVWIGSVNMVENSFNNNRESAVIIESTEIADFFADFFLRDWESTNDESISINIKNIEPQTEGTPFIIDATDSLAPSNCTFSWDIDGDGKTDREGKKIILTMPAGIHRIALKVSNGNEEDVAYLDVVVTEKKFSIDDYIPLKYIPILIISVIILALYSIFKLKRKNVHKEIRTKRH